MDTPEPTDTQQKADRLADHAMAWLTTQVEAVGGIQSDEASRRLRELVALLQAKVASKQETEWTGELVVRLVFRRNQGLTEVHFRDDTKMTLSCLE